jgi:hypothetical protein
MMRFSDEMIVALYVPRGLNPPLAEGEHIACARSRCARREYPAGTRAHRWVPREKNRPVIALCPRCHDELLTIVAGG